MLAARASTAAWAWCGVLLATACERPPPAAPSETSAPAPAPEERMETTFDNPILPGFHPDPSICRVGDDYYLVTSTFEYFPGVPIFHSKDLLHWRQLGHVLTRESQLPLAAAKSSEGIFAPTLRHHAGTFYLITTNVGGGGNFYVTASDPAGEWSEPIWLKEPGFGMDPSLSFDDDGRVYYTRHGGGERGGAYQTELDVKRGTLLGEPRLIWSGTGGVWPEGPHLYKIDGRYYLLLAEGGTSTGHGVTIARSSQPFGPFEPYAHNPILTHSNRPGEAIQATGHADLVQAPDGRWWMVFLGIRRWDGQHHHLGRETFLAPVAWNAEGWPEVNGGAPIALGMARDGLPAPHPFASTPAPDAAVRDEFDAAALGFDWNFLRRPPEGGWSLRERPGFLRLHGSTRGLDTIGSPAFVGRRQRHFRVGMRAWLDFSPRSDADRAGLVLRANEGNHYELVLTGGPGQRLARASTRIQGQTTVLAEARVPDGPVELGVEAFPDRYELSVSAGGTAQPLGRAPTAPLSSEAAGGFTGVYVGLFATTRAATPMPPADFDAFEYTPEATRRGLSQR